MNANKSTYLNTYLNKFINLNTNQTNHHNNIINQIPIQKPSRNNLNSSNTMNTHININASSSKLNTLSMKNFSQEKTKGKGIVSTIEDRHIIKTHRSNQSHQSHRSHHSISSFNPKSSIKKTNKKSKPNTILDEILKFLFFIYSQYGEKDNFNNLKFSQLTKFCLDSGIIEDQEGIGCGNENEGEGRRMNITELNIIYKEALFNKQRKVIEKCDYENFLMLLKVVSVRKYSIEFPDYSISEYLKELIEVNILPLYERLKANQTETSQSQTQIEEFTKKTNKPINKQYTIMNRIINIDQIIESISSQEEVKNLIFFSLPGLYDIYKEYFINTSDYNNTYTSTSRFKPQSEMDVFLNVKKIYMRFLSDFDICPLLINKNIAYSIFNSSVIDSTNSIIKDYFNRIVLQIPSLRMKYKEIKKNIFNEDMIFEGSNQVNSYSILGFYISLFKISDYCYFKMKNNILNCHVEKNLNLQLIKSTNSYENLSKNNDKFKFEFDDIFHIKFNFILEYLNKSKGNDIYFKRTLLKNIIPILPLDHEEISKSLIESLYKKQETEEKEGNSQNRNEKTTKRVSSIRIIRNSLSDHITSKYGDDLLSIFIYYCSFGDNENTSKLKITKFYKFLEESNLLKSKNRQLKAEEYKDIYNIQERDNNNCYLNKDDVDIIFFRVIKSTNENEKTSPKKKMTIISSTTNKKSVGNSIFMKKDTITEKTEKTQFSRMSSVNSNSNRKSEFYNKNRLSSVNDNMKFDKKSSLRRSSSVNAGSAIMSFDEFVFAIEIISKLIDRKDRQNKQNDDQEIEKVDLIMKNNILPLLLKVQKKHTVSKVKFQNEVNSNTEYSTALNMLIDPFEYIFVYYSNSKRGFGLNKKNFDDEGNENDENSIYIEGNNMSQFNFNDYIISKTNTIQDKKTIDTINQHRTKSRRQDLYRHHKMSFYQFFSFCRDFEIFPHFSSKFKLKAYFTQAVNREDYEINEKLITITDFVYLIGIISFDTDHKSQSAVFKLIYLIDSISQSDGMKRLIINTSNMSEIKNSKYGRILFTFSSFFPKYKEFIENYKKSKESKIKEVGFFDLLEDYF